MSSSSTKPQHPAQDGLLSLPLLDTVVTSDHQPRRATAATGSSTQEGGKQGLRAGQVPVSTAAVGGVGGGGDGGGSQPLLSRTGSSGKSLRNVQPERKLASLVSSHATVEMAPHPSRSTSTTTAAPILPSRAVTAPLLHQTCTAGRTSGAVRQLFTTPSTLHPTSSTVSAGPPPLVPVSLPSRPTPPPPRSASSVLTSGAAKPSFEQPRHPPPPLPPQTATTRANLSSVKLTSSLPSEVTTATSSKSQLVSKQLSVPAASVVSTSTSGEQSQNVIEQILKTPSIFQEAASQIAQPKKYSDAVGKKPPALFEPPPSSSQTLKLTPIGPTATTAIPPPVGSGHPKVSLNLAPGSRPLTSDMPSKV